MRRVVVLLIALISACDSSTVTCGMGLHSEGGMCVHNATDSMGTDLCTADTCAGHGSCTTVDNATSCACEAPYEGADCSACPTCPRTCATSGLDCGPHGTCDESGAAPVCTCTHGTEGATCATCKAPAVTIINDPFGGSGEHHRIDISPGAVVVSPLPALGAAAAGSISFSQVANSPADGAQNYTLAFSRCPGDVTSFSASQVVQGTIYPCTAATTNPVGIEIRWNETVTPSFSQCALPPADGPWFANLKIDYDPTMQTCTQTRCQIDWQWN